MIYKNPYSLQPLTLSNTGLANGEKVIFPTINGAVRVVSDDNYATNFGFQWRKFKTTQIDRELKDVHQSKTRLFATTGWDKENLSGKDVLEVGSGAGRFSQIILDYTEANLFSVDYSNAVESNYENNSGHGERFKLFQASIYELPFEKGQFDKVLCFGVLQHTPDVKRSVECLAEMVKPGGELIVDFYPIKGWWTKIHAKYLFRPFTKRKDSAKLLSLIEANVDWMISVSNFFNKIGIGKLTNRFIPICDFKGTFPPGLSKEQMREHCVLDTFDMFSPAYDQPQKIGTVRKWFEESGFTNIFADYIVYGGNNGAATVKGTKK